MDESATQRSSTDEYWCHKCYKTVNGQTLEDNRVVCSECNEGFVMAIASSPTSDDLSHQFRHLLELAAESSSQPSNRLHETSVRGGVPGGVGSSTRGLTRRNLRQDIRTRLEHWGLARIGNFWDYADDAEFESILNNFAENDDGGDRGAPPAADSAVAALKDKKIESDSEVMVCVVCKDSVTVGETAKELPCGHGYHEDCIVAWLAKRNMCPVCRYELPTSDPDYEEERIKKNSRGAGSSSEAGNDLADQ